MSAKPQTALEFAFTLRCYVTQKADGSYLFDAAAVTKLVAARDAETRRMAMEWRHMEDAPKDGSAILATSAGPQIDIIWWDAEVCAFRDYYHKQKLADWTLFGWMPLPEPADITKEMSRRAATQPAREAGEE